MLFADAGPGPLLVPLGGSVIVAGIFLSLACVAGGLWLAKASRPRESGRWKKWCLICSGGAFFSASFFTGFIGLWNAGVLGALVFGGTLALAGVAIAWWGARRPGRPAPVDPDPLSR
jgi:hypothetical protein